MSDADLGLTGEEPKKRASRKADKTVVGIRDDIDLPVDPEQAESHFRVLGHHRGSYYFLPSRGKQVIKLRAGDMGRIPHLLQLAPLQWWEREFPSESGFKGKALAQAANYLIASCYGEGVFRVEQLRGRGCWMDDGRPVVHFGDKLMVDGTFLDVGELQSRFVYEAMPALPSNVESPLPDEESRKLLQLMKMINWERPVYATLAAGWVVAALAAGALEWRPHIMITGPSGCGKSWLVELIQTLLGEFALAAKGESSEAGLRQAIQHDALPVTWDEAEGEDIRTTQNLDRVLGLMRQASADVGGKIFKGGADGGASSYTISLSFLLSAIRVPIKQSADESRITVLTLLRNGEVERLRFASDILPLATAISMSGWTEKFRARVLRNITTLRDNSKRLSLAAGAALGNQRLGDQIGPMLAGAALLSSTKPISEAQAIRWVAGVDMGDQAELTDERDEDKLLSALMEAHVRVPTERTTTTASVGELIGIITGEDTEGGIIDPTTARLALARHGMLISDGRAVISNTHREIGRLLRDTAWGVGWSRILKRLDGAEHLSTTYFAGARSRAVSIPLTYFSSQD